VAAGDGVALGRRVGDGAGDGLTPPPCPESPAVEAMHADPGGRADASLPGASVCAKGRTESDPSAEMTTVWSGCFSVRVTCCEPARAQPPAR